MFEGDVGTTQLMRSTAKAHYLEIVDNSCATNVDSLQRTKAVLLVQGQIHSIETIGNVHRRTIKQGDKLHVIEGDADLEKLSGVVRIPLDGSSRAINQLIRACMCFRLDIENNCGI